MSEMLCISCNQPTDAPVMIRTTFDDMMPRPHCAKCAGEVAAPTGSGRVMELVSNAADIGLVSGVLQGLEFTVSLLPNQKEAITRARKAIDRLATHNQVAIAKACEPSTPPRQNDNTKAK